MINQNKKATASYHLSAKDYGVSLARNFKTGDELQGRELAQFVDAFKSLANVDDAKSVEMRRAFAATLAVPLLQAIPPLSTVRNIFAVDEIPRGALAEYPVDMQNINNGVIMPYLGAVPQNIVSGDSITVPTFNIANSVEYNLDFVRDGRYNVVERAMTKLAESMVRIEESQGWAVINAAISGSNTFALAGGDSQGSYLSKKLLNRTITQMRKNRYKPTDLYVSPNRAADIRDWASTDIDFMTQREIFQAGGLGSLWNITIHELDTIDDQSFYLFDTSRFGVMPIRQKITTFDLPDAILRLRGGVGCYETVGFYCADPNAVIKGVINGSTFL